MAICWAALALGAAGCGGSSSSGYGGGGTAGGGGSSGGNTVSVGPGIAFAPSSLTVAVGDTVTWSWSGGVAHSVTSGSCSGSSCAADGKFSSPTQSSGSFQFTFSSAGDYPYYCVVHGAMMTATIHVQ